MQALSALQHDALVELFNIGVGQAAGALADIVGEEVTMSVPTIRFVGRARACALLAGADGIDGGEGGEGGDHVCGVRQRYDACAADSGNDGPSTTFRTAAIVIFAEHASLDLVRLMVGDAVSFEELTTMEQEAMGEIGNIVLNACVGTLANLLGQELRGSLPVVQVGSSAAILAAARGSADPAGDPIIMLLQIDLALEAQQIRGYIAFLLEMDAMDGLRHLGDSYLAQLAGGGAAAITSITAER